MNSDDIETQDYIFMKCLQEKICKRNVTLKTTGKQINDKSLISKNVINAFDLDEISFLTGLNFNIVSDTGAKLIRMKLANKIMWEDDQNNEKRYLWYLSENGEKYLEKNSYKST